MEALHLAYALKSRKRTGWVNHKVKLPESIADHMYFTALLTLLIIPPSPLPQDHVKENVETKNKEEVVTQDEEVKEEDTELKTSTKNERDKARELDRMRCFQMAFVHDFAESIVGDITPYDGISKAEKHQMEKVLLPSFFSLSLSMFLLESSCI